MDRIELELYLNNLLETARFKDYCPNGLQVEGRRRINKLATGVTASVAFLEAALDWGAWDWATNSNQTTAGLIAGLLMAPIAIAFAWSLARVGGCRRRSSPTSKRQRLRTSPSSGATPAGPHPP